MPNSIAVVVVFSLGPRFSDEWLEDLLLTILNYIFEFIFESPQAYRWVGDEINLLAICQSI